MARGLTSSAGVTAFIALVLLHETCSATAKAHPCAPSSCGDIDNISSPFRLKTDPENCGDPRYELSCENNHKVVYLAEGRKYYVQEINYSMYTIRVVEPGIRGVNIRPNLRTRHEPNTGFFGLGLGLNGFGS